VKLNELEHSLVEISSTINTFGDQNNNRLLNSIPFANINPQMGKNYDMRKIRFYENLASHSFLGKWKTNEQLFNFSNNVGKIRIAFQHAFGKDDQLMFYSFLIMISDGDSNNDWLVLRNNYLISLWNNNTTKFDVMITDDQLLPVNQSDYVTTLLHNYTAYSRFTVPSELIRFKKFDYVLDTVFDINFTAMFNSDVNGKNLNPNYKITGSLNSKDIDVKFEVEAERDGSIFSKISKFSLILCFIGLLQLFNYKHLAEKFSQNENSALKVRNISLIKFSILLIRF